MALVLAAVALVVLAAAPHALFVDNPPGEASPTATTEMRFWWDQMAWDLDHETVPGASSIYGAIGVVAFLVGSALTFVAVRSERSRLLLGGLSASFVGALLSIHYSALWTGRSLTSLVHLIAGFDGPAALLRTTPFTPDAYSLIWVMAPTAVLGLVIASFLIQAKAVAKVAVGEFDLSGPAKRHLKTASLALVVLAVLFVAPLSVQELPDNYGPSNGAVDNDSFWFSAYDTYRINEGTLRAAEESNRGNLVEYEDLGNALGFGFGAVVALLLASILGVHGSIRGARGDRNLGNLWQGGVYLGAAANVALFLTLLLTAFLLHKPNADLADRSPFLVLFGLVPVFLGLMAQLNIVRTLMRESGTLLADDFPEPIIYD